METPLFLLYRPSDISISQFLAALYTKIHLIPLIRIRIECFCKSTLLCKLFIYLFKICIEILSCNKSIAVMPGKDILYSCQLTLSCIFLRAACTYPVPYHNVWLYIPDMSCEFIKILSRMECYLKILLCGQYPVHHKE